MALIQFTTVVGDASGRAGDTIYSKNKGGSYIRTQTVPVQPDSPAQLQQRALVSAAIFSWQNDLDDDQRAAWAQLASTHILSNRLGKPYRLSGNTLFTQIYTARVIGGLPITGGNLDAPANLQVRPIAVLTMEDSTVLGNDINFLISPESDADENIFVDAVVNVIPTINFVKNLLRFKEVVVGPTAGTITITDFSPVVALNLVAHIRIRRQNRINGALSPVATGSIVSTA